MSTSAESLDNAHGMFPKQRTPIVLSEEKLQERAMKTQLAGVGLALNVFGVDF